MTDLAAELAGIRSLGYADLVARYQVVVGKAPRVAAPEWIRRRLAWALQAQRFGGLSDEAQRRIRILMAAIEIPTGDANRTVRGTLRKRACKNGLPNGSYLEREWHGQRVRVLVVDDGFEWQSKRFRSLSAVARAVTGTGWNGKLFFGLVDRRKTK